MSSPFRFLVSFGGRGARLLPCLLLGTWLAGAPAAAPEPARTVRGSLVLLLTTDEPASASHALHFAQHTFNQGRRVTVVLIGKAGSLAVTTRPQAKSAVTGQPLDQELKQLVEHKIQVAISPYSLAALGVPLESIVPGITPPANGTELHAHMWEPDTKLVVW